METNRCGEKKFGYDIPVPSNKKMSKESSTYPDCAINFPLLPLGRSKVVLLGLVFEDVWVLLLLVLLLLVATTTSVLSRISVLAIS